MTDYILTNSRPYYEDDEEEDLYGSQDLILPSITIPQYSSPVETPTVTPQPQDQDLEAIERNGINHVVFITFVLIDVTILVYTI